MISENLSYENNKHLVKENKKVEDYKNMYIEMKKSPLCIQYKNDNWKQVVEFVKPHSIRRVRRGKKKSELVNSGRAVIRVIIKDYPVEYGYYILRLSYHAFVVLKEEHFNEFFNLKSKFNDIMVIDNFTDLLALAKKARDLRETQMYLFRNKNGRNRRTESSEIEDYYDAFTHDLGAFVDEISGVMNKYRV